MGQKINPLGFRLGTNQSHHSFWFAEPKDFPAELQEDERIRDSIKNYVQKNMKVSSDFEGILRIEIRKGTDFTTILIYIGFPNLLKDVQEQEWEELWTNVEKTLNSVDQKLKIFFKKIEKPYGEPKLLAEYIALQLKNRVSFRKAMKKAIELTKKTGTKGIRIQIAGCIGGKERARVVWTRKGRVPLNTIHAKIDYYCYTVRTIHGALGIKIWMFANQK
uniref:Small ribosomal subunit protein uS3c n=1 Tax=Vallisneria denseserrulata x Vallisneria spiralis TaxID=1552891 RepID=A0A9E7VAT6_9LILI|nr:ribosomal protein S3 [Vallisneria denseserrulata x Vallisneria spiralis]UZC33386.1 ribosomal protein S3 [Vallisneria denseserrulata x Vallisneria spiralis]